MPRNDPLMKTSTKATPQTEQADPRQVPNNAGGYAFQVKGAERIRRFLTLGTEGGTYYQTEKALTRDNAKVVVDWAKNRSADLAQMANDVSVAGRAPRNNPALYALAAASALGDDRGRRAALNFLPLAARTGTHLYTWAGYRELFGGWGRGAKRAVAGWYLDKDPDSLAYQMIKYRQREGWTHRDLLRLSHPQGLGVYHVLFDFACGRGLVQPVPEEFPAIIADFIEVQAIGNDAKLTGTQKNRRWTVLAGTTRLPWEAFPDAALRESAIWRALIERGERGMPQTALMRQLPRLTGLGVLEPMSDTLKLVCAQLADREKLIKARVHPVNILIALKTYAAGRSDRHSRTWAPVPQVIDALNDAFYLGYAAVEPAGKRTFLALDVSGSMGSSAGGLPISCREATAALALVTANTEPDYAIAGFTTGLTMLGISPKQRLDDAVRKIANLSFGGTDCSLPMQWALKTKTEVDTFQVYTDNETWGGSMHVHQALRKYRDTMGINARLAVVGMTATDFTIADPDDPGTLDVAGFDSAIPGLLADFSRGDI